MERELSEVRIGALCWNQYTDWPSAGGRVPAPGPAAPLVEPYGVSNGGWGGNRW